MIIELLRDWLPSFAVVIGAGWILFNWIISEQRRKRREVPSLEGVLETSIIRLSKQSILLSVEAKWTNTGTFPLRIHTQESFVRIFKYPKMELKVP